MPMTSFSPGSTASCILFLPSLVNYPDHLSPSVTRHVGTAALQMACQSHNGVGDQLIHRSWILDVFQPQSHRGVDLYADRLIHGNIQYLFQLTVDIVMSLCAIVCRIVSYFVLLLEHYLVQFCCAVVHVHIYCCFVVWFDNTRLVPRQSDHLTFLFCSAAGFVCVVH